MKIRFAAPPAFLVLALAGGLPATAQDVFKAAGDTAESIQETVDAYRAELGGGDTSSGGGLFGGVRREINWDGSPDTASDPNFMPATQFQNRGATFTSPGEGVKISANAANPTNTPILFSSISADYANQFQAFTAQRTFSPIGSNRIDLTFSVAGSATPALTRGLGVVFVDVDLDFTTSIEYFALDGTSLGKFFVPAEDGQKGFSFLGVDYDLPLVARVQIVLGNTALNQFGDFPFDAVITDDFIYGEPVQAPAVDCIADGTTLCLTQGRFEITATFTTPGENPQPAQVQRLADDSGAMWFFSPNNLEVLAKLLDACGLNDRFWFYAAAATDLELEFTVTDTETGQSKVYAKPAGRQPPITDSDAFATCN